MLIFGHQQMDKFYDKWDGPYTFTYRLPNLNYVVTWIGQKQGVNVHLNRIKPLSILRMIQSPPQHRTILSEPSIRYPPQDPTPTATTIQKYDVKQTPIIQKATTTLLDDISPPPRRPGRPGKIVTHPNPLLMSLCCKIYCNKFLFGKKELMLLSHIDLLLCVLLVNR